MKITSKIADINTPTGVMRTYIHQPIGDKKYPTVLFYSEIFQQTDPIASAARIIASHGYVVMVPEVFHELNPIGTVLGYDEAGRVKGNTDKTNKDVQSYDADNAAMIDYAKQQPWFDGNIGAMGFLHWRPFGFPRRLTATSKSRRLFLCNRFKHAINPQ